MSRAWEQRKQALRREIEEIANSSPVMTLMNGADMGEEMRFVVRLQTQTLVIDDKGEVAVQGPVFVGIRYNVRFLSEAPNPFELVCILAPARVFQPNCDPTGAMCLGHPQPGISLMLILNQTWAGLNLNMKYVKTGRGDIANPAAAAYVRANVERFPIHGTGLFEELDQLSSKLKEIS